MKYFADNIEKLTEENTSYRKVIYTGPYSQLVLMTLQPGEEIGAEIHEGHDQFLRIEEGKAKFVLDGNEIIGEDGFAVVVPSGCDHNVINVGDDELKLYTIYSPAEHPEGTLQETKAEADAAE
ncbi:cupin domain-containing protein [Candidatus Parcubacteria bacterium]|nr:cupin domain-containing protein [Candidatus Parcubacteria bacterium]